MISFSVVMPVRNALPYLDLAIESVLAQTRGDFDFIIGNDGSTDGSDERIRHWAARDNRITVLESAVPQGPVGSSNWVARAATQPLVARVDADDISHPDRFRRQLDVFAGRPDAALVATLFESIDERGTVTRHSDRSRLLRPETGPPISHGSIMYRRALFEAVGGYAAGTEFFEDLDLYDRMARVGAFLIIPESLYSYRFSSCSARLNADVAGMERVFDNYLRNADNIERAWITGDPGDAPAPGSVRPEILKVIGSLRLWSGHRPHVLRRLLRESDLRWNASSARILAWAAWGAVSPGSLRGVLRLVSRLRELSAAGRLAGVDVVEWQPPAYLGNRTGLAPKIGSAIAER